MTRVTRQMVEAKFRECLDAVGKDFNAFPWTDRDAYICWLGQTYHLVRNTTRLICVSAGKCTMDDEDLHRKSIWHLKEEWDHDQIALADLKHMDVSIDRIPELPQTAHTYQANYYFMDRYGPYAVLGYSYMLEGLAAEQAGPVTDMVAKTFGPKSCRFLRVHAEEDAGHVKAGLEFLATVDESALKGIYAAMVQGRTNYALMLEGIQNAVKGKAAFYRAVG